MPASVQELLMAAKAKGRTPLISLLEGAASGVLTSMKEAPMRQQLAIQQRQQEILFNLQQEELARKKREDEMARAAIRGQQDAKLAGNLSKLDATATGKTPPDPGARLGGMEVVGIKTDPQGFKSRVFAAPKLEGTADEELNREVKRASIARQTAQAEELLSRKKERGLKREDLRDKERLGVVEKFNSDKVVKTANDMLASVNIINGLVLSGNPIAANSIPTFMARASGEVGNLSEADKRPFGGSQAILEKIKAVSRQAYDGQLTEANAKFVSDFLKVVENRANQNRIGRARDRAKQIGAASDFITEEEALNFMIPGLLPARGAKRKTPPSEETKEVVEPDDVRGLMSDFGLE